MTSIRKVLKTFIPFILIVGAIIALALVSQIWAEVKEEPVEIQYVSYSN